MEWRELASISHQIILFYMPLIFALSVHEASHAWVAKKCGDDTAYLLGRISLNPLRHIDIIGTVILPILNYWTFNHAFGWAKATPYNAYRLSSKNIFFIAAAGPIANLILAFLTVPIFKILIWGQTYLTPSLTENLMMILGHHIYINVMLFLVNILPIYPLDGSNMAFCPYQLDKSKWLQVYADMGPYLLFMLMSTGLLFSLIQIPFEFICCLLQYCL